MKIKKQNGEALSKLSDNLVLFLKEKGLLDIFISNFISDTVFSVAKYKSIARPIEAFTWRQTKEGYEYWNQIDLEYNKWKCTDENS
jgi:hypothetical protein